MDGVVVRDSGWSEELARIGRAVAHPVRVRVLEVVAQGEFTVEELAERLSVPLSTLSSHLKVLRDASLVATRREGTHIHYSPGDVSVTALVLALRTVAERRSAQMQQLVSDVHDRSSDLARVDRDELARRIDEGDTVLIDVRPRREFDAGHIDGAVSMPLEEFADAMAPLPHAEHVVAYCRDRYCLLAPEAARALASRGLNVAVLDSGYIEWAAARGTGAA